jgi:hypothetical protein
MEAHINVKSLRVLYMPVCVKFINNSGDTLFKPALTEVSVLGEILTRQLVFINRGETNEVVLSQDSWHLWRVSFHQFVSALLRLGLA